MEPAQFDELILNVGSDGKIRYEDFIRRMVAKREGVFPFYLAILFLIVVDILLHCYLIMCKMYLVLVIKSHLQFIYRVQIGVFSYFWI